MEYISTRGQAPILDFEAATLTGLATDGGLYLPRNWPVLSIEEIRSLRNLDYASLACRLLPHFVGDSIPRETLEPLVRKAYGNFYHDAVAPIKQLDDQMFFMELFHGPTLAFKDYALQMLGQFFQHFLDKNNSSCTIVGATSGDTGSAAIAGVRGLESVSLFMLHPKDRVSEVQRRQMTTVLDDNIHNLSVDGTFDDCQTLVKRLFNDLEFRERYNMSAVNSINWARIASQVVYYFQAALALGAPDRIVNFSVPTGNFGNVLAGYVAREMGLPIGHLIIGSNRNDILTRFFETGTMEQTGVMPTLSPSMDIQISSNFERYLFELLERDSDRLRSIMEQFSKTGKFTLEPSILKKARATFRAYRMDDDEATRAIKATYQRTGEIIEPHSIIGVEAARNMKDVVGPTVVLGTAHPAKFPDAVRQATGVSVELPGHVGNLMDMEEKSADLSNDLENLKAVIENTRN